MRDVTAMDPRLERYLPAPGEGVNPDARLPLLSEVEPNLWIGGCQHRFPLATDFAHVVSLYQEHRFILGPGTVRHRHRMRDSDRMWPDEQLHSLADQVNELRAAGRTLVHCQAGRNRSALVVALALVHAGMTPTVAIELLRARRSPLVLSNQTFEQWLLDQTPSDSPENA